MGCLLAFRWGIIPRIENFEWREERFGETNSPRDLGRVGRRACLDSTRKLRRTKIEVLSTDTVILVFTDMG